MARTVEDAALLLSAMAGPDARSPISLDTPGERFAEPLARDFSGVRIAWSRNLGGLPVDPRVTAVLESRRGVFAALGCEVVEAEPDWEGADDVFKTLRAWVFSQSLSVVPDAALAAVKDTVRRNALEGRKLSGDDVGRAEVRRTAIYHRVREFMREHEFLVLPVSQVPPFEVERPYPEEIAGVRMQTYIDWMKSAYFITVTGHPAISVPCGFTPEGLPVGVQIVGRHRDDFGVLQLAYAFEQATELWRERPPL